MSETAYAEVFLSHLVDSHLTDADRGWLDEALRGVCERGRGVWPSVDVDPLLFCESLSLHASFGAGFSEASDAALGELYLATGCVHGDGAALAAFDAKYMARVAVALSHMKLGKAAVDEVRQRVREKLLVAKPGETPKVLGYAGQERLEGLVAVVAVRTAVSMLRKEKREVATEQEELLALPTPENDPELYLLERDAKQAFGRAFEHAVRALTSRQRNMLRLHLIDGLSIERVGDIYGVHRGTVTRWMAKARKQLLSETRRFMQRELDMDREQFESMMRLVRSRLDVSVGRLLRTMDATAQ